MAHFLYAHFDPRRAAADVMLLVLNARGVGDTYLDVPQTFSALFTSDVRFVLESYLTPAKIEELYGAHFAAAAGDAADAPPVPIIGLAFSLGGLILSNYAGEEGRQQETDGAEASPRRQKLAAILTVTTPHSLLAADTAMNTFWTKLVYNHSFFGGLRRYYDRHQEVIQRLPGIDAERLFSPVQRTPTDTRNFFDANVRTVRDFDEHLTAPHFGCADAFAYYRKADTFTNLRTATIPQLCIVARNDIICGAPQDAARWLEVAQAQIDRAAARQQQQQQQQPAERDSDRPAATAEGGHSHIVCVEFPVGGHLGFLQHPWAESIAPTRHQNEMERLVVHAIDSVIAHHRAAAAASP
ncbi:hypothetical protein STCU_09732 [Strigomonas culicis]|uniref:AB hydrolase-1 domain-containing protein n=1 Tax=Strigomonas culicis TaxID=28005 RepID=S9UWF5_9TRYP|nr:hypothetical protein STCU_09732 [Strigomonas culicis]|eukprot:EPY18871.1 hypothetical protein STCU_09732 [Strigomonas culicis]